MNGIWREWMISIDELNEEIIIIENEPATHTSMQKLANLYIVRDHILSNNKVVAEYRDILPSYSIYCNNKKKYKLGEITETPVIQSMNILGKEIKEFLQAIYSSTESDLERQTLFSALNDFLLIYNK